MWDTLPQRLVDKIIPEPNSGCWLWLGVLRPNGYGAIRYHGIDIYPHRLVYELTYGNFPIGLVTDHLCSNRACCNPDHLEAVTQAENVRRYKQKREVCKRGHPYNEKNTYVDRGRRQCRECGRLRKQWERESFRCAPV